MSKKNFLNINRWSNPEIHNLITLGEAFKHGKQVQLKHDFYAANLFFENSTRTHSSFQMAEKKLGIKLIGINPSTSSVQKGESLGDTIKTLQAIGVGMVVIRHSKTGWYLPLEKDPHVRLAMVNAGDGHGQHPSQTLLDLMTIHDEFGHFKGLTVGIVGDLSHSRVARSDGQLLNRLGVKVLFGGPKNWYPKDFDQFGTYVGDIDKIVPKVNIIMMLRVQRERLSAADAKSYDPVAYHKKYGFTEARAQKLPQGSILMHPAPVNRGVEISSPLVEAPISRIFPQMHNGVFARMAIIATLLKQRGLLMD